MRDIISLACGECKRRNYSTTKNKKKTSSRLEFSKFCRFCRKHNPHKETKYRGARLRNPGLRRRAKQVEESMTRPERSESVVKAASWGVGDPSDK